MRRLFAQIWLAMLAAIAVVVLAGGVGVAVAWMGAGRVPRHLAASLQVIARQLPPPDAPAADQAAAVVSLSDDVALDLDLFTPDGAPIQADHDWTPPLDATSAGTFVRWPVRGIVVRLADGRILAGLGDDHAGLLRLLALLVGVGLVVGIAAWPVSRRLTRRLEALRDGVSRFGGDLGARLDEGGGDEVADVARAFNASAGRIEALVVGQRRQLAGASHELRSPLARLRMALELVPEVEDAERTRLLAGAVGDVDELDGLVAELLLAARMEGGAVERQPVDLGALAAEEAARVGATSTGDASIPGDRTALRRMLRNLLENAVRHGAPPVSLTLTATSDGARVTVSDAGPGVPEGDRERIFEPFHRAAGHAEGTGGGVGLGLALVRQIARAHGGDAACEAGDGGTRFVVTLAG